ncbi:hypothetical protein [Acinetobacter sp.]|uniref:hypothetical protein n=1 Tax=Acinetobacter sp. TaxID=472 RepID=UPI003C7206E2
MPFIIGILCFGLGYWVASSKPESEQHVPEHNQDIAVENFIQHIQPKGQTQPGEGLALQQQLKNQKTQVNLVIDSTTTEQIISILSNPFRAMTYPIFKINTRLPNVWSVNLSIQKMIRMKFWQGRPQ